MYMLVGLPGSGKSTYRDRMELKFVSSDHYIEQWAIEQGKTYQEIFKESVDAATKLVEADVIKFNEDGISWIWDQTNLNPVVRARKLAQVSPTTKKVAIYFDVPVQVALDRNASRERVIPLMVFRSMHRTLKQPTLKEGFDEVWVVDQNGTLMEVDKRD